MQPGRSPRWLQWGLLLAGFAAFAAVLVRADLGASAQLVANTWPWLLVALVPYIIQLGLDSLAWKHLLVIFGRRVPWVRLLAVRMSTEAVLMSMPGGSLLGETLKPYLLHQTDRVPVSESIASIGAKKCLLVFAQAAYLTVATIVGWSFMDEKSEAIMGTTGLPLLAIAAIALLLGIGVGLGATLFEGEIGDRVHRLLLLVPVPRFRAWLDERREPFVATDASFQVIARGGRRRSWLAFALLVGAWFVEAVETWVLLVVLGIDLPFFDVLVMESCVVFLRYLAFFVPAGLGIQDAGYLSFLGAMGAGGPHAGAFVLLKRAKELFWVAAGYLTLFVLTRSPRDNELVRLSAEGALHPR